MKHILIISTDLNIAGGLERMVVNLANLLVRNKYKVSLMVIGNSVQSFYTIHENVEVRAIDLNFGIGPQTNYVTGKIAFIKDIIAFKKKITNINPDLIIITEYPQTSALVTAGIHKTFPIIAWQHTSYSVSKSVLWKKLSDYAYKKVAAIVCLTEDEETFYKTLSKRTYVIPNFIELPESVQQNQSCTLLTVARLVKDKGIDLLTETTQIILKKYPDWKWKVIGDGPLKQQLHSFIEVNNLQDRLLLFAPAKNLSTEYASASIYVLTSRRESFGQVLPEAMSYGLPCIAFDCDNGPRHIITNNIDGILVEKEAPVKLAEAISALIEDKEKRSAMGKAALENVKRFSSEIILQKWEELFNELLP